MNIYRRAWFLGSLVLMLIAGGGLSRSESVESGLEVNGQAIKLESHAKAFVGSDNISVEVAPYRIVGSSKRGGIVVIHGIEGELDGQAVPNEYVQSADGWEYASVRDGQRKLTLRMQKFPKESKIQLFYPGNTQDRFVVPSDGMAEQTNPRAIYDLYRKQLQSKAE